VGNILPLFLNYFEKGFLFMYKAIAKVRIAGDPAVDAGQEIIVTKEQLAFLEPYLKDITEVKQENKKVSDKPAQASSKVKKSKK
jgi:hypothetical protein